MCKGTRECRDEKRVENKYYFLFYCGAYAALREKWMESTALGDDFHQLSEMEEVKVLTNLGKLLGWPNNLGLDRFTDPVDHFGAPWQPF